MRNSERQNLVANSSDLPYKTLIGKVEGDFGHLSPLQVGSKREDAFLRFSKTGLKGISRIKPDQTAALLHRGGLALEAASLH